ncbi:WD40 repeat-containing protein, putative [Bodo saltans]|uniref:WD40 repeat-containing protein, putative n=1 Tax=Bodo saltans TaxID=75058 RepID=A0A0S4JK75_BODSA|nr:WD40 repeat-containing protein, putative [Bodo saltans]|eukprot:CUG91894.1 WD40 repeat-containing protein, putative [Bodo saltans]
MSKKAFTVAKRPREESSVAHKEKIATEQKKQSSAAPQQQKAAASATSKISAPSPSSAVVRAETTSSSSSSQQRLPPALLVVGTYHSVMAGLALRSAGAPAGSNAAATALSKFFLKFSIKHHVGCVSGVAVCDRYIASCGTDERMFLFTVKDRGGQVADLGSLAPASEVRALAFQGNQHLVCGCADGTVNVYRTRDWESVYAVQVHEKSVESLALHPNGALCITVGSDRFVSLMDMSSGKLITKVKLPGNAASGTPLQILFSTDETAENFAVVLPYEVIVFDTRTAEIKCRVVIDKKPPHEIQAATFVVLPGTPSVTLLVGTESGSIYAVQNVLGRLFKTDEESSVWPVVAVDLQNDKLSVVGVPEDIATTQAGVTDETRKKFPTKHATRVKTLSVLPGTTDVLVSADTNGALLACRVAPRRADGVAGGLELVYQCSANCQGRVTSITGLSR